jgi:hypothetical protein
VGLVVGDDGARWVEDRREVLLGGTPGSKCGAGADPCRF